MGNERWNWNMSYWPKIKLLLQRQWWDCSNQMLSLKTDVTLQKPVMKHKAGRAPHMSQIMSKTLWKTPSSSFPSKCTTFQVIDSLKKTPSWLLSQFNSAKNVIFGHFDVIASFLINLRRSILRYLGNEWSADINKEGLDIGAGAIWWWQDRLTLINGCSCQSLGR